MPRIVFGFVIIFGIRTSLRSQVSHDYYTPPGILERTSSKSNIFFKFYNDGAIFDCGRYSTLFGSEWPKSSGYVSIEGVLNAGLVFGCIKDQKKLVSSVNSSTKRIGGHYFSQFVPGVIGNANEPIDTAFSGIGWKYVYDINYIPYVSSDFDDKGIDISGNNFPDWPVRLVNDKASYIHNVSDRSQYPPVYKSDEDFFTVFKDTETQSDPEFVRPDNLNDTMSTPIGIEVREYCYSFNDLLKNVMIISYEVINKSGKVLDASYVGFRVGFWIENDHFLNTPDTTVAEYFSQEPLRNLGIVYNKKPLMENPSKQIYCGLDVLESPANLGLTFWKNDEVYTFPDAHYNDTLRYYVISSEPKISSQTKFIYYSGIGSSLNPKKIFGTGPFRLAINDTARFTVGLMFAYRLNDLLILNDIVQKVFDYGIMKPVPPQIPTMIATPSVSGIHLKWDTRAEQSVDPVISDTLGKPFIGYRLYRSSSPSGPFILLHEWKVGRDSIVHEYKDTIGENGRPLMTNVRYYYKLTSFDEGVPLLEMGAMESNGNIIPVNQESSPSSSYELENIRIVPNPFIVTHAAQQSVDNPKIFFNYLPNECTIRIYTVGLELVAELKHKGGSREEWNLRTQGGQQVASQLLIARITTPQGTSVTKKVAVVFAE